jgi:hypothetical protein
VSERIPRVYARRREVWDCCLTYDEVEIWEWMSVNHTRDGDVRIERWSDWEIAMRYCLLWAPNSGPDAPWRKSMREILGE